MRYLKYRSFALRGPTKRQARGQTMTEYAMILAAIAIAAFVAFTVTGTSIDQMVSWTTVDHDLLGT